MQRRYSLFKGAWKFSSSSARNHFLGSNASAAYEIVGSNEYFKNVLRRTSPGWKNDSPQIDSGIKPFLMKTYMSTFGAVAGTLSVASTAAIVAPEVLAQHPILVSVSSLVASLMGVWGVKQAPYKVVTTEVINSEQQTSFVTFRTDNSSLRLASYGLCVSGLGVSLAYPLYLSGMTAALPTALVATGIVFGSTSLYALVTPPDKIISWGPALASGLLGSVVAMASGMVSEAIFGVNTFSTFVQTFDMYGGIVLFAGLTGLDTARALKMYQEGMPDHLGCSLELTLDFLNMLVRFLRMMSERNGTNGK